MYALFYTRFLRIFVLLPCLSVVTLTALLLRILKYAADNVGPRTYV